jgi:hypothetical protein
MRFKPATVGGLLLGICALATGTTAPAYPAAGALACPGCYGFEAVGSNIFIDRAASPAERNNAIDIVREARTRVRDFYGSLTSWPRIMICIDDVQPIGREYR